MFVPPLSEARAIYRMWWNVRGDLTAVSQVRDRRERNGGVSPTDPRWIATLRGIEQELVSDSLVYRYHLGKGFSDGLTPAEVRGVQVGL